MKILHLNDIAGVPSTLAKEQNARGHHARVLNWEKPSDQLQRLQQTINAKWDVIHCHSCSILPLNLDWIIDWKQKKQRVIYHHHGSDIRYQPCNNLKLGAPHLVSTRDLTTKCPVALYTPNPVENLAWRRENNKFQVIQRIPRSNQPRFFKAMKECNKKLLDLPRELFGVSSLSGIQAESQGTRVYNTPPHPHEVAHVCDLLDYVYERLNG